MDIQEIVTRAGGKPDSTFKALASALDDETLAFTQEELTQVARGLLAQALTLLDETDNVAWGVMRETMSYHEKQAAAMRADYGNPEKEARYRLTLHDTTSAFTYLYQMLVTGGWAKAGLSAIRKAKGRRNKAMTSGQVWRLDGCEFRYLHGKLWAIARDNDGQERAVKAVDAGYIIAITRAHIELARAFYKDLEGK